MTAGVIELKAEALRAATKEQKRVRIDILTAMVSTIWQPNLTAVTELLRKKQEECEQNTTVSHRSIHQGNNSGTILVIRLLDDIIHVDSNINIVLYYMVLLYCTIPDLA